MLENISFLHLNCLLDILVQTPHRSLCDRYLRKLLIENLGLKPRRSTTALPLNTSAFTKYMLKCETWKKLILTD
ncbi:MAG: hypothetical protein EWV48_12365, partial [Microcystis aeruginosa Ma_QC_C_20070823_S13]